MQRCVIDDVLHLIDKAHRTVIATEMPITKDFEIYGIGKLLEGLAGRQGFEPR
jgi:hypothetical protein